MRIRAAITTTTALLALTTLAACSSSDDKAGTSSPSTATPSSTPSAEPSTTPTTADPSTGTGTATLEKAVSDYTAALFSGTASGYDVLSARCKKQMTKDAWVTMAKDAHQQYGAQKATGVKVDQMAGDLARVSYGAGNIPQFEREGQAWTREGGTWRWDACPSTS